MVVRQQVFGAWQKAHQALGLMDEHGKMRGANVIFFRAVEQLNQGNLLAGLMTGQALGNRIGHGELLNVNFTNYTRIVWFVLTAIISG
jgi:hypothetical protein